MVMLNSTKEEEWKQNLAHTQRYCPYTVIVGCLCVHGPQRTGASPLQGISAEKDVEGREEEDEPLPPANRRRSSLSLDLPEEVLSTTSWGLRHCHAPSRVLPLHDSPNDVLPLALTRAENHPRLGRR